MLKITNAQILRQIELQGSIQGAARALGISWQTVAYAKNGQRKGPDLSKVEVIEDACTCCGKAPKAPGNRYLCLDCYQTAECGVIWPESETGFNQRAALSAKHT